MLWAGAVASAVMLEGGVAFGRVAGQQVSGLTCTGGHCPHTAQGTLADTLSIMVLLSRWPLGPTAASLPVPEPPGQTWPCSWGRA